MGETQYNCNDKQKMIDLIADPLQRTCLLAET
jgi:hypothetical protein